MHLTFFEQRSFQVQEHSGTKTAEMHCFWVMFPVYPSVPEH